MKSMIKHNEQLLAIINPTSSVECFNYGYLTDNNKLSTFKKL